MIPVDPVRGTVLSCLHAEEGEVVMVHPRFVVGLVLILVAPAALAAASEAPTVVTGPVVLEGAPAFRGSADLPLPPPAHPPFDEIPPAPMPAGAGPTLLRGVAPAPLDGGTVVYDALTGEQRPGSDGDRELLESPGMRPGIPGRDGGPVGDEPQLESYSNMSTIGDTSIFPWRANAKMVMRFEDSLGNDHFYNCSGTMIDPEVVLTAAHCIYLHEPNGTIINDWAEEVWVYPGWDGVGVQWSSPSGTIINPYGYARGTYYIAGTGWVSNSDPNNYDVGAVRLTRAAGSLTGTFGWAWDWDCATWILSETSYNASYPGEGCGTPGLHNGRDMYFWSGTMDWCDPAGSGWENQLFLDTTGGCFNAGWGGMSGSSVYFFHGSDRLVHGVASRSDRATWVSYARMWAGFASDLGSSFIPGTRGSSFDLQALDFSGPATATAGDTLAGTATFFAANPTNGSANTTYPLDLYLSTNSNISTSDTHLGSTSFGWNFAAMSSVTVTIGSMTIPLDTPTGDYFLGTILAASVDGDASNNDTDEWDAHPISISGVWDMVAVSVNAPSGTFSAGDSISVSYTASNRGGDASPPIYIKVYASTNTTITSSDTLLYSDYRSSVAGGGTVSATRSVTLPPSMAPGTYYIGIEITPFSDYTSSNNDTYDATPIQVQGGIIFQDGFESGNTNAWSS